MAQRGQLYVSSRPAIHNDQPTIGDESSPLLPPAASDVLESQSLSLPAKIQSVPTQLPKAQLICLCVIRLVDPIAFTQIFPYINEMMAHLHLTNDPLRVGFYSGLAESAFSISSLFSIYQWARLSGAIVCCYLILDLLHHWFFYQDVIGRRPVIFIGIIGVSLATLLFGLQRTLPGILLVRCIGQSLRVDINRLRLSRPSLQVVSSQATRPSSIRYWAKLRTPRTRPSRYPSLLLPGQSVLS